MNKLDPVFMVVLLCAQKSQGFHLT
jgi:hypothetical protein